MRTEHRHPQRTTANNNHCKYFRLESTLPYIHLALFAHPILLQGLPIQVSSKFSSYTYLLL